jgi:hypothetical protein
MVANKAPEAGELGGKLKACPDTPAEADAEEGFVALGEEVIVEGFEFGLDFLEFLLFYGLHDVVLALHNRFQHHLGNEHIEAKFRKGVCHTLVSPTECTEDVRDNDEHFVGATDLVHIGLSESEFLSLGFVVSFECRPGPFGTALPLSLH